MRSNSNRQARSRRRLAQVTALGATCLIAGAAFGTGPASASSHREAPGVAGSPRLDNTDLYAFVSPDKPDTVTLIANWMPFEEPAGGPNFYTFADDAQYDIPIDTNGDSRPNVVYRWTFHTTVKNPGTFLYNTGPVTSLTDPDLNYHADLRPAGADQNGRMVHEGCGRTSRSRPVQRRARRPCPTTPSCATQADVPRSAAADDVRRSGRRPVLPRPAGLRPAVRRQPVRGRATTRSRATTSTRCGPSRFRPAT